MSNVLNSFIQRFPYKAGTDPDDLARHIQKNGIKFKKNTMDSNSGYIMISQFPDYHPDDVAEALYKMAEENIESIVPGDNWHKPFTQSGLYHRPGIDQDWKSQGIDIKAYDNTMKNLIKYSSPYLEYSDALGFDVCRENFFIYPEYKENGRDVERLVWEDQTLPEGRNFWLESKAQEGNYSMTCLQFHYGIPLFSIDQFEEWKHDYDKMLLQTDRPIHKFDPTNMREPFIATETLKMDTGLVQGLYAWLIKISKEYYPAFYFINDIPVLNAIENPKVKQFYYLTQKKCFIAMGEFIQLLEEYPRLYEYTKHIVELNMNKTVFDSQDYLDLSFSGNKSLKHISKILENLIQHKDSIKHIGFEDRSGKLFIWLSSAMAADNQVKEIICKKFYTVLDKPVFKDFNEREILDAIIQYSWFQKVFWEKCQQARDFLNLIGKPNMLHDIFKEEPV